MPNDKETKIVKGTAKKETSSAGDNSKVEIRAVDKAIIEAQIQRKKAEAAAKSAPKRTQQDSQRSFSAPPVGKPMPKSSAPVGKPMPKNAVPVPKNAVPMKKADSVQNKEKPVDKVIEVQAEEKIKNTVKAAEIVEKNIESEPVKAEPEKVEAKFEIPEVQSQQSISEEEKTEAVKEVKTVKEEKKEAPKAPPVDYTPHIGIKIVRTASQEAELEKAAAERRKAEQAKRNEAKKNNDQKKNQDRKPKEFVGRNQKPQDNAPRKKNAPTTVKGENGREKVVAFTASPSTSGDNKRRKGKDKDLAKDKRNRFEEQPVELAREKKNKHSKYKEKIEVVNEEEILIEEARAEGSVVINVPITLGGFCEQIEKSTSQAIMALMKMGIMANINQNLDEETAVLLGMELGVSIVVNHAEEVVIEEGIDKHEDSDSELLPRPPIITVMGHVDHGKTSLLDAIRKTNVTAGEAGGITQHIGASEVEINGQRIVFLDTPGHEAFTAMRARGAHITDIAVLVVAADDSVKPQTIESISHAKAAGVPIIVAINKMDKPAANPDRVKKDLADQGVLVEDWGGDVISVPVSAKKGDGIKQLLEMILLQAEVLELKANPNRMAMGTVIEAKLDKARGPVATLLVDNGTLQMGAPIVVGTSSGRVRAMINSRGDAIRKAGPATAVEITGLTEVPEAGDEFYMVKDEKTAREIAESRKAKLRAELLAKNSSTSLEKLFSQLAEGEVKDLNIIIKADVQGSVGALEQSLEKIKNDQVRVRIIHTGVGAINESDVMLAGTSNAIVIGFNVRPSTAVQAQADRDGVEIRCYRIIYEIIDDIEAAIKGMLAPEFKEVILGKVEVRDTFKVPGVGIIAGAYVTEGKVVRNAGVRLVRDGIVIHEGTISSLKRFKDDAKEVREGFECGLGIDKFNDIKVGDIIEAYEMQEIKREE